MSDSTTRGRHLPLAPRVSDATVAETLKETRSLRAEETSTTMNRVTMTGDTATVEDVAQPLTKQRGAAERSCDDAESARTAAEGEEEAGSGVWKLFKRGKGSSARKSSRANCPRGPMKRNARTAATRPPISFAK